MTLEKVRQVIEKYELYLKETTPDRTAERRSDCPYNAEMALSHVLWMFGEVKKEIAAGETEKVMRWLGFIQGVLWTSGTFTIDEMRDDNRT